MTDSRMQSTLSQPWPQLPRIAEWQGTFDTVHLWTQIVGKVRMENTPLVNHWWNVPLYVTPRGLSTSTIPHGVRTFQIEFDFLDHKLQIDTSDGLRRSFALAPMTVAEFYRQTMQSLEELGVGSRIRPLPVELPDPIQPFPDDTEHSSYDTQPVEAFWRALVQADRVLNAFRARHLGKASPVHFFWGAFDLAATRFSGRTAPTHPGGAPNVGDWVMHEAYSHEVSSAGLWPGAGLGEAAFYCYAYPEPEGFRDHSIQPREAYYHPDLREFVLPYEAVRSAADPDAALLDFLQSTYEAAAELAGWDRRALERHQTATA